MDFVTIPDSLSISLPITLQKKESHPIGFEIRVSKDAQVDLAGLEPDLIEERKRVGDGLWDPSRLEDEEVELFLQDTFKLSSEDLCLKSSQDRYGERFVGKEQALMILKSSGYHVSSAKTIMDNRNLVWGNVKTIHESWTESDLKLFGEGMAAHYKDFSSIQKYMAAHGVVKRNAELIEVYYKWKISPYYQRWKMSFDLMDEESFAHDEMSDSETAISQSENSVDSILLVPSPKRRSEHIINDTPPQERKRRKLTPAGPDQFNLSFSLDDGLYVPQSSEDNSQDNLRNDPLGAWNQSLSEPFDFPLYCAFDHLSLNL